MHHGVHRLHNVSRALIKPVRSGLRTTSSSRTVSTNAQNVAVLGGGITGLATAYYITQHLPKVKVTLFEASDRIGGWLLTNRIPVAGGSVLFEAGPRSLRPAGNGLLSLSLIEDLDLADNTIWTSKSAPASNHRYLYYPDHLVRMPHPVFGIFGNVATLLSEPIFNGVLARGLMEPFQKPRDKSVQDESIGDFLSRRFGPAVVDNIVSGVFQGIYAGDVYNLSARSLMPTMWNHELEQNSILMGAIRRNTGRLQSKREMEFLVHGPSLKGPDVLVKSLDSSVFTFTEGIGMLVDRLARKLWESGSVSVQTATRISSLHLAEGGSGMDIVADGSTDVQKFDHVISALSPAHLNTMIKKPQDRIPEIPSVTVMTVNLFFRKAEHLPPGPTADSIGFGYLIPQSVPFEQNPERALGVVFDHAYSPPRISSDKEQTIQSSQDTLLEQGTKVTVMLGGHWWNGWPAYPNEKEGLTMARAVLERHLGITQEPEAYQVNLQRDCIPQYTVGHQDKLMSAHQNLLRAYQGKLRVAGSWISGVGVNDCLRSAWDVVHSLKSEKHDTGLKHVGNEEMVRVIVKTTR